jgi:hypothetical protein
MRGSEVVGRTDHCLHIGLCVIQLRLRVSRLTERVFILRTALIGLIAVLALAVRLRLALSKVPTAEEPTGGAFKYWAFISYSRQDEKWGHWLHRSLETYHVPRKVAGSRGRDGIVPRRLLPIFRDIEELPASSDLGKQINESLEIGHARRDLFSAQRQIEVG